MVKRKHGVKLLERNDRADGSSEIVIGDDWRLLCMLCEIDYRVRFFVVRYAGAFGLMQFDLCAFSGTTKLLLFRIFRSRLDLLLLDRLQYHHITNLISRSLTALVQLEYRHPEVTLEVPEVPNIHDATSGLCRGGGIWKLQTAFNGRPNTIPLRFYDPIGIQRDNGDRITRNRKLVCKSRLLQVISIATCCAPAEAQS